MVFADHSLAQRLERTEGLACREFAEARQRLSPKSAAAWMECNGACAVFDGVDSPVTQSFGLGMFAEVTPETLERMEAFFFELGAAAVHEVSPLAGVAALDLLCARGYRPVELSSVLHRAVECPEVNVPVGVSARVAGPDDATLWAEVSARGWSEGQPELGALLRDFGVRAFARAHSISFLAELEGQPAAAGTLCLHDGVALFGGATTVPEVRCRGLQSALLAARMRYASSQGCDLAMMVTEAGSQSQRNAERLGFRVAYTRTKWRLGMPVLPTGL